MRVALVGLAVLMIFGVMSKLASSSPASTPTAQHVYTVLPGDTVFSIAERFDGGGNVEAYEYRLLQELGGSSSLYVGEKIALPSA
jgi:predicted Zn-dependent protease